VGSCGFSMIAFGWKVLVESWRWTGEIYRAYRCRLLACLCGAFGDGGCTMLLKWRGPPFTFHDMMEAVGIMTMGLDSLFGMGTRMLCALMLYFLSFCSLFLGNSFCRSPFFLSLQFNGSSGCCSSTLHCDNKKALIAWLHRCCDNDLSRGEIDRKAAERAMHCKNKYTK